MKRKINLVPKIIDNTLTHSDKKSAIVLQVINGCLEYERK